MRDAHEQAEAAIREAVPGLEYAYIDEVYNPNREVVGAAVFWSHHDDLVLQRERDHWVAYLAGPDGTSSGVSASTPGEAMAKFLSVCNE